MRQIAVAVVMIVTNALGLGPALAPASASDDKETLFVVVTSPEPQTQGMAMVLSIQAVRQGADVEMLLCGPGGDLALKDAPQTVLKPRGATPQGMLVQLIEMGVQPQVCALYLPNSGKTAADLIDGVGVAKPPAIAAGLLKDDTRLFTF